MEPEYLALTQPERDPASFEEAVKEAYLLEHGCRTNVEIAEVLGVDKSRITQLFANAADLEAKSIRNLLSPLKSREHRKRIVRAWARQCFGEDIDDRRIGRVTGSTISEKTVRRIDRQIRESRLSLALRTALEAADKTDDWILRQRLFDRAYFVAQRLDEPGRAMVIVRRIAEDSAHEPRRRLAADLMRVRILESLADSRPEEVQPILEKVTEHLAPLPKASEPKPPYVTADLVMLSTLRLSARITFMERGFLSRHEPELRAALGSLSADFSGKLTMQRRVRLLELAARIHLLLSETFKAQELLEQAFTLGKDKQLNIYETAGLIQAKVARTTESLEDASRYLQAVRTRCMLGGDRYHQQLAEYDLARIESERMAEL